MATIYDFTVNDIEGKPVKLDRFKGKVQVNGAQAHPLWKWLTSEAPGFLGTEAIKWNFTKFLVDRNGRVVARFAPNDTPEALEDDVAKAL